MPKNILKKIRNISDDEKPVKSIPRKVLKPGKNYYVLVSYDASLFSFEWLCDHCIL